MNKYKIFPASQKEQNILNQLYNDGVAYTHDTNLTLAFGTRRDIKKLIDEDFLDITRSRKKRKSIIVKSPRVNITPVVSDRGTVFYEVEFIRSTI